MDESGFEGEPIRPRMDSLLILRGGADELGEDVVGGRVLDGDAVVGGGQRVSRGEAGEKQGRSRTVRGVMERTRGRFPACLFR